MIEKPEVRSLAGRETPAAITLLAAAFADDDAMIRLQPDPVRRRRMLERWYRTLALVATRRGRRPVVGAFAGGRLVGASVSHDAGTYPAPAWTAALHAPAMALAGPRAALLSARWLAARERVHPRAGRFLYLELLGADPAHQRAGAGRALLGSLVAEADARGLAVVLHTNAAVNVGYYERAGFAVTHEQHLPIGVPEWLLERPSPDPPTAVGA